MVGRALPLSHPRESWLRPALSRSAQGVGLAGLQGAPGSPRVGVSFWRRPLTSAHVPAGFFEMKVKYDESDNVLIRASRALTDKVTDLLGE